MITRATLSTIEQGLPKYRSMLAGNSAFNPYSFESIATASVGGGGTANVDFTSIPSTYTHLQIRVSARSTRTFGQDTGIITFNNDTGTNYTVHGLTGNGASVTTKGSFPRNNIEYYEMPDSATSNSPFGAVILDILDYGNTNKWKTVRMLFGFDRNGAGNVELLSGLWMNTNAITSIKLSFQNANIAQNSHFALYGIKSAS